MSKRELTIFTPNVVQPIETQYIDLGDKYEQVKNEFVTLVDSVKDVEITEEYLGEAAAVQKTVNALYKEVEGARIAYKKHIEEVFYKPIADKIQTEIKEKYSEWENTFKKQKMDVEKQLLDDRIAKVSGWFTEIATEQGLDWLTLEQAMDYGDVKITRKNPQKAIVTASNDFIEKVKGDMMVLEDNYGSEEKAEYIKSFNLTLALESAKARREAIKAAEEIEVAEVAPTVVFDDEPEPVAPAEPESDLMTRVWRVAGTREQLIALAKYAMEIGVNYEPIEEV